MLVTAYLERYATPDGPRGRCADDRDPPDDEHVAARLDAWPPRGC